MEAVGRRERKKAEVRARISDTATALFLARGFDAVSVSEVAEAADVARPTVFAHFPRKEDLLFDRYQETEDEVVAAVHSRPAGSSPVRAVADLLVGWADQGHPASAMRAEFAPFWRLVAGSRALQGRARELAERLERALARAMRETGAPEPELTAALVAGAYRSVHLHSIARILAGDDAERVAAEHVVRIRAVLGLVERATSH
jgi:AcrR family transcriptional regulator